MDSVIEEQRRLHEDRERLTDTMMREWLHDKKTHKEQINSDHRMKLLMDRFASDSRRLDELYQDRDSARKEEVTALGGPNEFAEFYNRLKRVRDVHRRNPDEIGMPLELEFKEMNDMIDDPERVELEMVEFTDEEGYGKYLDMNAMFEKYINLKGVAKVDYVTYLSQFDRLYDVPKETKKTGDYRKYLQAVLDYFRHFLKRTKPLLDIGEETSKCDEQFERQWREGTFAGWSSRSTQQHHGALMHSGAHLDLSPFNSPNELESLGLDRLKSALMALELKCGGTLQQRAQRLFSTKGKQAEDIDASLKAAGATRADAAAAAKEQKREHDIALLEAQLYYFAEMLSEQRAATIENVERKQARTVGEEVEEDADTAVVSDHEDDDDDVPYNPKNLPLGWDGKPIPYWLYKLHGLNISYPCEICGNQVYKGPKAFQRHFSEWRHSHGMRCLGIPNTAHFANITKISDAIELWQKLRENKDSERFKPELEEEYEDSVGNVVSKKIYDDLKRQGLL